ETVRANDRAALAAGRPLRIEEQVPHGGGGHTHVSVKFPLPHGAGAPVAGGGVAPGLPGGELKQGRRTRATTGPAALSLRDPQALGFGRYVAGVLEAAGRALEVERASYWRFNEARDAIVCVDRSDGLGNHAGQGEVLRLADFPAYFAALEAGLSIAA